MKNVIILICACSIIILQSCVATIAVKGKLYAVAPVNEVVVNPSLRNFLNQTHNPRVVLRVPSTTSNVTAAESERNSEYNNLYGRIEKELMKEGYTVRDRNLLNNLLSSGQNLSYKEIGEKVETDIIIEVISIISNKISNENKKFEFEKDVLPMFPDKNKLINGLDKQLNNIFTTENYTIDCKVILVSEGTTVGMFTFNYCSCEDYMEPCDMEVRTYRYGKKYYLYPDSDECVARTEGETGWYRGVNFKAKLNTISEILSHDLVKILHGKE
jgi:hypothetical protein